MSFWDYVNPFSDESPFNPVTQFQGVRNAVRNPSETFKYLEDRFRHPTWKDIPGALGGAGMGIRHGIAEGQADANAASRDFGALSDQDLYRIDSETDPPNDNPFVAAQYGDFEHTYNSRNRPRVYSTDNSFVFPDTAPVKPNTALIPATGEPVVTPAATPTSIAGTPPSAEVTAQTATPGLKPAQVTDTVASQFKLPSARRSSRTVR